MSSREIEVIVISDSESEDESSKGENQLNRSEPLPRPIARPIAVRRRFRPIVIDGSNVAILHGNPTNTFSSKGIKIAVEYFLNLGCQDVTAFIPMYRRHINPYRHRATTDVEILDDLAGKQQLVYTPSRRVRGINISSYDDRFIVGFAAMTGGIIVSNDNFRDIKDDSIPFNTAVEERLLMFLFVGDIFMIPDDPLGRDGPPLSDFLRFPPGQ